MPHAYWCFVIEKLYELGCSNELSTTQANNTHRAIDQTVLNTHLQISAAEAFAAGDTMGQVSLVSAIALTTQASFAANTAHQTTQQASCNTGLHFLFSNYSGNQS